MVVLNVTVTVSLAAARDPDVSAQICVPSVLTPPSILVHEFPLQTTLDTVRVLLSPYQRQMMRWPVAKLKLRLTIAEP
jgi:hypothetical protein